MIKKKTKQTNNINFICTWCVAKQNCHLSLSEVHPVVAKFSKLVPQWWWSSFPTTVCIPGSVEHSPSCAVISFGLPVARIRHLHIICSFFFSLSWDKVILVWTRYLIQRNQIESPEINSHTCGQLIYGKGVCYTMEKW